MMFLTVVIIINFWISMKIIMLLSVEGKSVIFIIFINFDNINDLISHVDCITR